MCTIILLHKNMFYQDWTVLSTSDSDVKLTISSLSSPYLVRGGPQSPYNLYNRQKGNIFTHWPLRNVVITSMCNFKNDFRDLYLLHQCIFFPFHIITRPHQWCQHWGRWWLGAVRHQAITWANVEPVLWGHMVSLSLNILTLLVLKPDYSRTKSIQYHGCWCPGSLCHHAIISHSTDDAQCWGIIENKNIFS